MPTTLSSPAIASGLTAWLYQHADDREPDFSAIAVQADIDTDMCYLDGCYAGCGVCDPLSEAHGPIAAFDQFPPAPAEACTELGADTTPPRLGLLRRLHIAFLERRLDIVRDERDRYAHAGVIGPTYHRNSLQLQLQLMARIRELRGL